MVVLIDHNFGIISFQNEKAIFKLTEVWLSHESTAANRGLALGAILPVGTKVSKRNNRKYMFHQNVSYL